MSVICPLCQHQASVFYHFKQRLYHQCQFCYGIFMDPALWPDRESEQQRYLEHLNDVEDKRFQQFVSPITQRVQQFFKPQHQGLDFGAGHAPVITHVLHQLGFTISAYDPLFFNDAVLLKQQYDYICSCEVIEHFHQPADSFAVLRDRLKSGGRLFCMTEIYHEGIDFHRWNYKNDPTHVFIYHRNTISYIADKYGFKQVEIDGRLIHFQANSSI
ncbi:class I SAM-dependent methyltransferase [Methylophaga sulfidovorans]|nr:methyltransferase domain-containing protein [Methylophaga sulfidovorans]